jgi:hypothetical protein
MLHFVVDSDNQVSERDIELVFGPLGQDDEIVKVQAPDLAAMAEQANVFPSRGQSRKNAKKRRFWVWNPVASEEKVTLSPSFDRTQGWMR